MPINLRRLLIDKLFSITRISSLQALPLSSVFSLGLLIIPVSTQAADFTICAECTYDNWSQYMTIDSGDTLTNNGTLNNFGTLNNSGSLVSVWGDLNNGWLLNNTGTLVSTWLYNDGTLNNSGSLTASGFYNNHTVSLTGGTVDANLINSNGLHSTFNFTGGTLNVDTFNGDLFNTGGTLGSGHSPGTTTINGDYFQAGPDSTLLIEITGLLAGTEYDVLDVTGMAQLEGILEFDVDYAGLLLGDSFDILSADIIGGTFFSVTNRRINIDWRWELNYQVDFDGSTDVLTATVAAVPIPAAVWLFGSGLGLLGWIRRRKAA